MAEFRRERDPLRRQPGQDVSGDPQDAAGRGGEGRVVRGGARRVLRPARSQRRGQEHDAGLHHHARTADRRAGECRRHRRRAAADGGQAPPRGRAPDAEPRPRPDRARGADVPRRLFRPPGGGAQRAGRPAPGRDAAHGEGERQAADAVGWPAAAPAHRARPDARPQGPAPRRAHDRARPAGPPPAVGDAEPPARGRADPHHDHALHGGSRPALPAAGHHRSRPHPPDGHARRAQEGPARRPHPRSVGAEPRADRAAPGGGARGAARGEGVDRGRARRLRAAAAVRRSQGRAARPGARVAAGRLRRRAAREHGPAEPRGRVHPSHREGAPRMTAFLALLQRDLKVASRNAIPLLLGTLTQPILVVLVFGHILPRLHLVADEFRTVMVPGLMSITMMMAGVQGVLMPLTIDLSGSREVDERLLAPISVLGVAVEKVVAGAIHAAIAGLTALPAMMLLMHRVTGVDVHPRWAALLPLVALCGLLSAAFGLTIGSQVQPRFSGLLFAVILGPMMLFGCAYYPWTGLAVIGPLQYVFLLNPLVFMSESMRLAVTPDVAHMPAPLLLGGTAGFAALFTLLGARSFEKRTIV